MAETGGDQKAPPTTTHSGGTRFVVQLKGGMDDSGKALPLSDAKLQQVIRMLDYRLNDVHHANAKIKARGTDQITVWTPITTEAELQKLRREIEWRPTFEMRLVDEHSEEHLAEMEKSPGTPPPAGYEVLPFRQARATSSSKESKGSGPQASQPKKQLLVGTKAELDDKSVAHCTINYDPELKFIVNFRFTESGAKRFDEIAQQSNHGRIAIVLNGVVVAAPVLQASHFNGNIEIKGNFDQAAVVELGTALSFPLKFPPRIIEQSAADE